MTLLTDAQIDRYSRQIILPEVGGRGQERLLGARVAIAGDTELATLVATFASRAGVGALDVSGDVADALDAWPDCTVRRHDGTPPDATDVVVDVGAGAAWRRGGARGALVVARVGGTRATVTTTVRQWATACLPAEPERNAASAADPLDAAATLAAAAAVASEVLRVLLDPAARGRRQTIDLETGVVASRPVDDGGAA